MGDISEQIALYIFITVGAIVLLGTFLAWLGSIWPKKKEFVASCSNCMWLDKDKCRRFPESVRVEPDHWCAEWKYLDEGI